MNNFKRMLALMLALVVVLSLAACGGDTETTVSTKDTTPESTASTAPSTEATEPAEEYTFRIRVVDAEGNPVVAAGVQLCKADGTCTVRDTNEEGWAQFNNEVEDGYTANIAYLADYTEVNSEKVYFESGVTEMTLTLTVTYRIQVVDAEGNPVAGEAVTLVNEGKYAYTLGTTNEEGYAEFFNMVAEGYVACFGDHTDGKMEGVETVAFEGEATEVVLTKAAE